MRECGMAEAGPFDQEIERIGGGLIAMRAALDTPAAILHKAAHEQRLGDDEMLETARQAAEVEERQALEASLASGIAALSEAIERHKIAFDERELPTRFERWLGYLSRPTMQKLVARRWTRVAGLDGAGELLRRADVLCGLLTEERQSLLDRRKSLESDLAQVIDHRAEILQTLSGPDTPADVEAVNGVERWVALFAALVRRLNDRIATCNVLLHKLSVDTEDLLILYRVLIDVEGQHDHSHVDATHFPHLGDALQRFHDGTLIGRDLERLKQKTNAAFADRFAARPADVAPAEPVEPAESVTA
jgi:hypothetical protein